MSPSEKRDEAELKKFLDENGGQPVGVLIKRNPETGLFDAVTGNMKSVMTGRKLPKGTKLRLFKDGKIFTV